MSSSFGPSVTSLDSKPPSSSERDDAASPAVLIALRLHLQGASEEALKELEQSEDESPDALLIRGQILFELKQFEEAAASFKKLADEMPKDPIAAFNHGLALARLAAWPQAVQAFQSAVIADPEESKAWFALGIGLLNQQKASEAHACFRRSLELTPDYAPAWIAQAASLQIQGEHSTALRIYDRMINSKAAGEELLTNALLCAIEAKDPARSSKYAARLIEIGPQSSAAALALFSKAVEAGDFEQAGEWCSRLSESKSDHLEHWLNLASCYQRLGQEENAAAAFERALTIQPNDLRALEGLAHSLSNLGKSTALDAWRSFLDLAPENGDGWFQLGVLCYDAKEFSDAANAFEKCVQRELPWEDAWFNLANCRWAMGASFEASEAFQTVLTINPLNKSAKRALTTLAIAEGTPEAAESYHDQSCPDDWDLSYNLGALHQRKGNFERAVELFKTVTKLKPGFAEAWLNLGTALFALGRTEESRQCWRSALEKKPTLSTQFVFSAVPRQQR